MVNYSVQATATTNPDVPTLPCRLCHEIKVLQVQTNAHMADKTKHSEMMDYYLNKGSSKVKAQSEVTSSDLVGIIDVLGQY